MSIDDEIEDVSAHGLKASLDEEIAKMMKRYCVQSVYLNVTFVSDDNKSRSITCHCGNFFAAYGSVRCWITSVEESDRISEREDRDSKL